MAVELILFIKCFVTCKEPTERHLLKSKEDSLCTLIGAQLLLH